MFLGFPYEIWIAVIISVLVRLRAMKGATIVSTIITIIVALCAGMWLHEPFMVIMNLSETWTIPIAILIALSAENVMKGIVELTSDSTFIKDIFKIWISKK